MNAKTNELSQINLLTIRKVALGKNKQQDGLPLHFRPLQPPDHDRQAVRDQGLVDAHAVRIRPSGALWFIDLHVTMNGSCTLNESHAATEAIEKAIQATIPKADVTIHVEPAEEAVVKPLSLQTRGKRAQGNT